MGRGVPVAVSTVAGEETWGATGAPVGRATRLLPLSAKSDAALRALARTFRDWLDQRTTELISGNAADPLLSDLAWTAAVGRSHFDVRAGVVFCDAESLGKGLASLAEPDGAGEREPAPRPTGNVVFAYGGKAGPWLGAEELYESEPVFRAVLDRCEELIREERGASLLDAMFGGEGSPLESPDWSGPALYAVQCGLTALWSNLGIRPKATTARDAGKLAAAQAAGTLGLEDGLRLAAAGEAPPGGGSANPELTGGSEIVMEIGPGAAAGFAAAVAEAYEAGLEINFEGLFAGETRRRISLPGYPFERRRYWIPDPGPRT